MWVGKKTDETPNCHLYSILNNKWGKCPSASEPKHSVGATIINSVVYMIGGKSKERSLFTVERLNSNNLKSGWMIVKISMIGNSLAGISHVIPLSSILILGHANDSDPHSVIIDVHKRTMTDFGKAAEQRLSSYCVTAKSVLIIGEKYVTTINKRTQKIAKMAIEKYTNGWDIRNVLIENKYTGDEE